MTISRTRLAFLAGVTLTCFAFLALRLTGLAMTEVNDLRANLDTRVALAEEATPTCILLAPSLNAQAWSDLTSTWGTLDYDGGRVYDVSTGTTLGYSLAEDGDLWNLPSCLTD